MSLPQAGDLVRLLPIGGGKPYEELLGIVLGYVTKGAMRSRAKVVWFGSASGAGEGQTMCHSPSRLQVVK
tara:strand:+ start:1833 stop:2042 length:210 start_codon:yes stop_codon:yes gene_type:complete